MMVVAQLGLLAAGSQGEPAWVCCGCLDWGLCFIANNGNEGVSDSYTCLWDHFPLAWMLFPPLI